MLVVYIISLVFSFFFGLLLIFVHFSIGFYEDLFCFFPFPFWFCFVLFAFIIYLFIYWASIIYHHWRCSCFLSFSQSLSVPLKLHFLCLFSSPLISHILPPKTHMHIHTQTIIYIPPFVSIVTQLSLEQDMVWMADLWCRLPDLLGLANIKQ